MPEITRSVIMDVAHAEELDRYANGAAQWRWRGSRPGRVARPATLRPGSLRR